MIVGATTLQEPPRRDEKAWSAAHRIEAAFLAEMLKGAGVAEPPESFGGGAGEGQFASFLREAIAVEIVESGGIGLAGSIYEQLAARK